VGASAFGRNVEDRPLSFESIGRAYGCSGRSVSRWTRWISGLTDVEALARECMRVDPS
jgi:hypothetical protein